MPRIEAHYQFYKSAVYNIEQGSNNGSISYWKGAQPCPDADCQGSGQLLFGGSKHHTLVSSRSPNPLTNTIFNSIRKLPFDHITYDTPEGAPWTLYVDVSSPQFAQEYQRWLSKGHTDFKVRYKPAEVGDGRLVSVSGYGVELALKRTDYIVIDDRDAEETPIAESEGSTEVNLEQEDVADVKPLSSSELLNLGVRAASFIMSSSDPLDTLNRVLEDFPKHASALASHKTSLELLNEHVSNRELFLPAGYNVMLINGVQVEARQMDVFSLLEHMRKERKLINGIQDLGFSAGEAVDLVTHPSITEAQAAGEVQRYDYRDELEGGNIILWLNNIEKDKKYAEWPRSITSVSPGTVPDFTTC